MYSIIGTKITDKSDMWLMGDDDLIWHIKEGTGDALEQEDIDMGYVDYIYIDVYKNNLTDVHEDNIYDGGIVMLKKLYKDMTIDEIIDAVKDFHGVVFFIQDKALDFSEGVAGA